MVKYFMFLAVLLIAGCTPQIVKETVRLNAARCERYAELMEKKETTPDEDQKFIRANGDAWAALADRWK